MYYLISILLGLVPEVLYFTLFICYTKNIKEKRIKLFLLIGIAYFICMIFQRYKLIYYLMFVILIYIILKILYKQKTQIIDIFIISFSLTYLVIISAILFLFMGNTYDNYFIFYIINRIFIFSIFIFKNKFRKIYLKYCSLWNRNDNINRPIKSITLRNLSLILVNFAICITNTVIAKIIEIGMG